MREPFTSCASKRCGTWQKGIITLCNQELGTKLRSDSKKEETRWTLRTKLFGWDRTDKKCVKTTLGVKKRGFQKIYSI